MGVLTETQRAQYDRDGYLLASGLIPEDVAERAESALICSDIMVRQMWVGVRAG